MRFEWLANCWHQFVDTCRWMLRIRRNSTVADRPKGLDGWSWTESPSPRRDIPNSNSLAKSADED